jgi:hypothetical protein
MCRIACILATNRLVKALNRVSARTLACPGTQADLGDVIGFRRVRIPTVTLASDDFRRR